MEGAEADALIKREVMAKEKRGGGDDHDRARKQRKKETRYRQGGREGDKESGG